MSLSTRCWAYTLAPDAYPTLALPAGQVETRAPSSAFILSFMRIGVADPAFRDRDFAPRAGDALSFEDAEFAALEYVRRDIPPGSTNVVVIPVTDPRARRFRACWRQAGAVVPHVDLPLARTQRLNEIRAERAPKLAEADAAIARASDRGDVPWSTQLRAYRQALRDVPQVAQPILDAITTPEALDAWAPTWPVEPTP